MNKTLTLILVLCVIVAGSIWFFSKPEVKITNFEECARAGNPVMESYPRQCAAGGEMFVEKIQEDTIHTSYACRDGKTVDATFYNGVDERVDLILNDGRFISLPRAISASGARYAMHDESIVFWNKGDTAFILENNKETYEECVEYSKDTL